MGHRNKHAGKKCGRIHGHTYDVVCEFEFVMKEAAVTMLFSDIDKIKHNFDFQSIGKHKWI